jgi:hypothetical protein
VDPVGLHPPLRELKKNYCTGLLGKYPGVQGLFHSLPQSVKAMVRCGFETDHNTFLPSPYLLSTIISSAVERTFYLTSEGIQILYLWTSYILLF